MGVLFDFTVHWMLEMHRCNKEVSHTMVMGLKIGVYEVFTQANPGQVDGWPGFVGDCGQITVQPPPINCFYSSQSLYRISHKWNQSHTVAVFRNVVAPNTRDSLKLTSSVVPELLFLLSMWCQRSLRSLEVENWQLLHLCGLKVADLKCRPLVLLSDCTRGRPWLN